MPEGKPYTWLCYAVCRMRTVYPETKILHNEIFSRDLLSLSAKFFEGRRVAVCLTEGTYMVVVNSNGDLHKNVLRW